MLSEQYWAIMPDQLLEFETSLLPAGFGAGHVSSGKEVSGQTRASAPVSASGQLTKMGSVAVIDIAGVITRNPISGFFVPEHTAQSEIRNQVQAAIDDNSVSAMALRINSPGGVVSGVRELSGFLASCPKPVFAYADGLCASAAYWLASATGRIYAPSTASLGSIGVIWRHTDASKMLESWGLNITYITGGTWKAAGNQEEPLSEKVRDYYQAHVAEVHALFRADVAARMPVDPHNPAAWGDGQIFLADAAQKNGLICAVVEDFADFLAAVNTYLEENMNKKDLEARHPDLLAELAAEAEEKVRAEVEQKEVAHKTDLAAALAEQRKIFALLGGEELAAKVEGLAKAGIGAAQIEALKAVGVDVAAAQSAQGQSASAQSAAGSDARAQILAALQSATPAPLPGSASAQADPTLEQAAQAAIERISAL